MNFVKIKAQVVTYFELVHIVACIIIKISIKHQRRCCNVNYISLYFTTNKHCFYIPDFPDDLVN